MRRIMSSQNTHNHIVGIQVSTYQSKGYTNIKADHIGHINGQPNLINGHIPDVSAQYNGKTIICEIETADSINDISTVEQWKAFDRSGYIFHVSVPESALSKAKAMALNHNITVDYFWYTEGL